MANIKRNSRRAFNPGTTLQAAANPVLYRGTILEVSEKLVLGYQGTTIEVAEKLMFRIGARL
jgi:hypothetical protein